MARAQGALYATNVAVPSLDVTSYFVYISFIGIRMLLLGKFRTDLILLSLLFWLVTMAECR